MTDYTFIETLIIIIFVIGLGTIVYWLFKFTSMIMEKYRNYKISKA